MLTQIADFTGRLLIELKCIWGSNVKWCVTPLPKVTEENSNSEIEAPSFEGGLRSINEC